MIESVTIKEIDEKLIQENDPNAARHYMQIERRAKDPEIEEQFDKDLTPKARNDKYIKEYTFDTENFLERTKHVLDQLGMRQTNRMFVTYGINNTLLIEESDTRDIHDEFNRIEMLQIRDIVAWCYGI